MHTSYRLLTLLNGTQLLLKILIERCRSHFLCEERCLVSLRSTVSLRQKTLTQRGFIVLQVFKPLVNSIG
jgi:hypothetical protein